MQHQGLLRSNGASLDNASLPLGTHMSTSYFGLLANVPFLAAFASFALAQIIKFILYYLRHRELRYERLSGSGGMPSAHTAFIVGLTTAIGVKEGSDSSVFALSLVMALVIMYDATGVRLHAGRHATILNAIRLEMPPEHPVQEHGQLEDKLGHTPIQVFAGAVLGMAVGYLMQTTALNS